jgi:1,4-dihydroxy-2-naphthoate octaprenyltransferase
MGKQKEKTDPMSAQTTVPPMTRRRAWLLAIRPKTLPAAVSPVIVATALARADGYFALWPALAALVGALLLQIGSNLANDYFDAQKGADAADRLGPTRVTASGLLAPAEVRLGMIGVFALAALVGVYLISVAGWPIVLIGVAAMLAAVAYTGGPLPFGYYGLGDLICFLFFGPVAVCGTYYVQALNVSRDALFASIPLGALITAILVVNNLRDIDSDRRAGKITLAVRLGRAGTRQQYIALLSIAYATALVLALGKGSLWPLLPFLTLPRALRVIAVIRSATDGPQLNRALADTARLTLLYALALAAAFLLAAPR